MIHIAIAAALLAVAHGSANPPGGCMEAVCSSYQGLSADSFEEGNYNESAMWEQWPMPLIGFYHGIYNKLVNGGSYSGAKGTPSLNYQKYDYPAAPWATATRGVRSVAGCCNACRTADSCVAFQYFSHERLSVKGDDKQRPANCFLLTGGSEQEFFPGAGLPKAGSRRDQRRSPRVSMASSFLGGRCVQKVNDDPHFTGAHGTRFDFNGELEKSFCLTADKEVQVNALLKGYKNANSFGATVGTDGKAIRSWIRELGLLWKDAQGNAHALRLVARTGTQQQRGDGFLARAVLDGADVAVPAAAGASFKAGDVALTFRGTEQMGPYAVDKFDVRIGELLDLSFTMRVAHRLLQSADDAQVHFNLMINDIKTSERIHGVLGQTYRNSAAQVAKAVKYAELSRLLGGPIQADGESGKGFLEGAVADYETSAITAADCKFSAF